MTDSLESKVRASVEARGRDITDADQGIVELALKYARQIDGGVRAGGQDATKALYLGPHLLKTLGVLGCTPEARMVVVEVEPSQVPDQAPQKVAPADELTNMRRRRGGA